MKSFHSKKYLLGLPLLCLTGSVFAGPPVAYNGWSSTDGAIDTTASCTAAGITCTDLVVDDGFLYQTVETPDYKYMRFIVVDKTATGDTTDLNFSAETFVPFAFNNEGISQGLASMQIMRDGTFEGTADLRRSMMRFDDPAMYTPSDNPPYTNPDDMYSLKLTQKITDAANGYADTFDYTHYTEFATTFGTNPDSDKVIGRVMDISQYVDLSDLSDPQGSEQYFYNKRRMGKTGNVDVAQPWMAFTNYYNEGNPISTASSMTLGGDTVSWSDGDDINTSWVVQTTGSAASAPAINYQSVTNTTTSSTASGFDLAASKPVSPFDWDTNFGVEPGPLP